MLFSWAQPHFSLAFTQSLKCLPKQTRFTSVSPRTVRGITGPPSPFSAEIPFAFTSPFSAPHPSLCQTRMFHNLAKCFGKSLKDTRTVPEEQLSTGSCISCCPDQHPTAAACHLQDVGSQKQDKEDRRTNIYLCPAFQPQEPTEFEGRHSSSPAQSFHKRGSRE